MSSDHETQNDELVALSSIYADSFITVTSNNSSSEDDSASSENANFFKGGELQIYIDLPQPFYLCFKSKMNNEVEKHRLQYLPPLYLHFTFPQNYPSCRPPQFTLSCKWLNRSQLSYVCQQLDNLWRTNLNREIMFTWAQFLKENILDLLVITDSLDIDCIRPKWSHFQYSSDVASDVTRCDTSKGNLGGIIDCNGATADPAVLFSDSLEMETSIPVYDIRAIQDVSPNTNLIQVLVEYDEVMRRSVFEAKIFECRICFTKKLGCNCIDFWPCNHVYCKNCIKSYFEIQILEGNIKFLKCPYLNCDSEANPKQVEELVSDELYVKYDEILLHTTLSSLGDIQPCPRQHCQYPVTIEDCQGRCPSCSFVFCGFCRFGGHGVEKCKFKSGEAKKIIETYLNAEENVRRDLEDRYGKKYLAGMVNEFLSISYISRYAKECPKCRSNIEKIDGCNKMTCKRCNTYFCWLCEQILDKMNPYKHFNSPESGCFNRLFQGMDLDEPGYFEEDNDNQVE